MKFKEFKGTKGKWDVHISADYLTDEEGNEIETVQVFSDDNTGITEVCFVSYSETTSEEGDANAKLITQSPRMLQFITDTYSALTDKGELTIFETSQKLECENILKEILE